MKFIKMQAAGNDYVYIDTFTTTVPNPEKLAPRISDRHFGVGSDGLVLICPSEKADCRMRMFNADGTEAEMCGNAIRCVGKYVYEHKLVDKETVTIETKAGVRILQLHTHAGKVESVTVDMGLPYLEPKDIPVTDPGTDFIDRPLRIYGRNWRVTAVSMGNPHAIVFTHDIDKLNLTELGPLFEHHAFFPRRTNTEFVEILDQKTIKMRVWERGAGETMACGTGACASVVASVLNGHTERNVTVLLRGGKLDIKWDENTRHVFMTGRAETVFTGEYEGPRE